MSKKNVFKPVKVSYRKKFDKDGYVYNQTITLDKKFIKYYNKMVRYYRKSSEEIKNITCETLGISRYYDFYYEEIDTKKEFNYISQTQLIALFYYLSINNYNVGKIFNRNTIIKII